MDLEIQLNWSFSLEIQNALRGESNWKNSNRFGGYLNRLKHSINLIPSGYYRVYRVHRVESRRTASRTLQTSASCPTMLGLLYKNVASDSNSRFCNMKSPASEFPVAFCERFHRQILSAYVLKQRAKRHRHSACCPGKCYYFFDSFNSIFHLLLHWKIIGDNINTSTLFLFTFFVCTVRSPTELPANWSGKLNYSVNSLDFAADRRLVLSAGRVFTCQPKARGSACSAGKVSAERAQRVHSMHTKMRSPNCLKNEIGRPFDTRY